MTNVAEATTSSHRLLFVASHDDDDELAALVEAGAEFITVSDARRSWACKINDGLRATDDEWLFTGADDLRFHPDWFDRALRWAGETTRVIGTNDICNPRVMTGAHSTHTLFRRDYVEAFGTIDVPRIVMHEGYGHDFADDEAVATAQARGVYVHAFDAIVEHLHPLVGKSEDDATYRLGRKNSAPGRALFARRRKLWSDPARVRAGMIPPPARAIVVTATYGGYDAQLHVPAQQDIPTDFICVTDNPDLQVPAPWTVLVRDAWYDEPRLSAKVPKMRPGVLDLGCDDVVWVDASHEITSTSFARDALAARHDGVAAFKHPRRDCIYAEVAALLGSENQDGLYFARPLLEQQAAYLDAGYPKHAGLYACGVLAWDLRDDRAHALGEAWLDETVRWSHQDQVEFPVVCRRVGVTPGTFPIGQIDARLSRGHAYLANPWFRIHPHKRDSTSTPATVVIPFASDDPHRQAALEHVLARYKNSHPQWQVVVGTCEGTWSKGRALADAVSRAKHDVLVVADADCVVDASILERLVAAVGAGRVRWGVPHVTVARMTKTYTARVLQGAQLSIHQLERQHVAPTGGGIVVLARDAWDEVAGVDPRFEGWGGEDISFGWALETLCGAPLELNATLWHLWHPDAADRRKAASGSEELAGRYSTASGDVVAMTQLIEEVRARASVA